MNCGENRATLVLDFGSGCGQNVEGSTATRTHESRHESMHELLRVLLKYEMMQNEYEMKQKETKYSKI